MAVSAPLAIVCIGFHPCSDRYRNRRLRNFAATREIGGSFDPPTLPVTGTFVTKIYTTVVSDFVSLVARRGGKETYRAAVILKVSSNNSAELRNKDSL